MAESITLRELFVDALRDAYDAEKQAIKAFRKMAGAAQHDPLATVFKEHLEKSKLQRAQLEALFAMLHLKVRGMHCAGIAGIVEEGIDAIENLKRSAARDVVLIGSGKRLLHYEIAAYGALTAMARALELSEAVSMLQQISGQKVVADEELDALGAIVMVWAREE